MILRTALTVKHLLNRLRRILIFVPLFCVLLYSLTFMTPSKRRFSDSKPLKFSYMNRYIDQADNKFISNPDLFLIEPSILLETDPEVYRKWFPSNELHFDRDPKVLTFGTFNSGLSFSFNDVHSVETIYGKRKGSQNLPIHHFVTTSTQLLHIVVFYRIDNYLWVGKILQNILSIISDKHNITLKNFGVYEQIFDPFSVTEGSGNQMPDEVGHFLGQIPTSRYLPCTEASHTWAEKNNFKDDPSKARALHKSLTSMKSLMKALQFEFWIMSGTLLGWYRQCSVIPYTNDADYASWGTSLAGKDYTSTLLELAKENDLNMLYRFGEPTMTQEFSFSSWVSFFTWFKSDLFFIYPNETHFRAPFHYSKKEKWTYLVYPKFELCSAVLIGEKVLVPCTPEDVLRMEYTKNWNIPVKEDNYDWVKSLNNAEPFRAFNFSVSQYTEFS